MHPLVYPSAPPVYPQCIPMYPSLPQFTSMYLSVPECTPMHRWTEMHVAATMRWVLINRASRHSHLNCSALRNVSHSAVSKNLKSQKESHHHFAIFYIQTSHTYTSWGVTTRMNLFRLANLRNDKSLRAAGLTMELRLLRAGQIGIFCEM